jgi:hypothetical protein
MLGRRSGWGSALVLVACTAAGSSTVEPARSGPPAPEPPASVSRDLPKHEPPRVAPVVATDEGGACKALKGCCESLDDELRERCLNQRPLHDEGACATAYDWIWCQDHALPDVSATSLCWRTREGKCHDSLRAACRQTCGTIDERGIHGCRVDTATRSVTCGGW